MDMIGRILGNRYEILEKIGSGGMATVYKAKCKLLNRNVAIKILRDEFANDDEFIKRFQVEAQAAASLSHTNIVSIYDVGNENGMHYIVMELVEGQTLKEIITEKKKLPWRDAVKIASQIASGLEQAHKNHIIHRDIKPHNIIITKDGVAKVTDFGIAKAVSNSTINAFGSTIGSVHYFSPEHARGGYTDEKSDIYSLGVVLYEMVTGKLPFDADTPVSVAIKHLQETPIEPMKLNPDIPIGLNNVIVKAMQKDVNNRYASATAMNADLHRILKNPEEIDDNMKDTNFEYTTQKVPIVGTGRREEEIFNVNSSKIKFEEEEARDTSKKKGLTKKQAVLKLLLFILIAAALFFGTLFVTINVFKMVFKSEDVAVPNVVGYSIEEAEKLLSAANLEMSIQGYAESNEYPKDFVMWQERVEGYKLKAGSSLEVRVSKGTKSVLVTDVITMTPEKAKIEIEKLGLVYKAENEVSETVPVGSIIRQSPEVNTEVELGSTVTVYISAELTEGLVKVPSVMGKSEAEARKMLDEVKLVPVVKYIKNAGEADDVVVSQDKEEGTIASELDEITIVINDTDGVTTTDPTNPTTPTNPTNPTKPNSKEKTITIDLKGKGKRDTFMVRVEVQGDVIGTRIAYEEMHSKSDGKINVNVGEILGNVLVRVYIDDVIDSEQFMKE